ncbi:hypothetical protein GCM10007972_26050 [Iodidimonas muriae]|uniref:Uncharacterized protein n=1 Tax=Iodidimonas muriae TaxID=261467 RepID=A0ABQ2LG02_9PROT|nr:hypothetical protein [Iodidimonas muriae]GER08529.1 hypothetical protein JCM17843_28390 [Kordiimonadales bacterium JCM 17843]GGO16701.1 hypothetical protein GCM10007972_26050 [Iodidimonas muriae]
MAIRISSRAFIVLSGLVFVTASPMALAQQALSVSDDAHKADKPALSVTVNVAGAERPLAEKTPDPFSDFQTLDKGQLAGLEGGASLDLGDIAVNLSDQTAGISDTNMTGQFNNGAIGQNSIEQLSGINSLMFNTGNNVNFQSTIQVNVFVK